MDHDSLSFFVLWSSVTCWNVIGIIAVFDSYREVRDTAREFRHLVSVNADLAWKQIARFRSRSARWALAGFVLGESVGMFAIFRNIYAPEPPARMVIVQATLTYMLVLSYFALWRSIREKRLVRGEDTFKE